VPKVPESWMQAVYIVPCNRCRDSKGMLVEVRRGVRPVQGCSCARAQCPQWLVSVQLTRKVSRCTCVDGSKRNCPEFEVDMLSDWQPVQLMTQLSGIGMTWHLSDHTGKRVLDSGPEVLFQDLCRDEIRG